jgi:hypothetical protein
MDLVDLLHINGVPNPSGLATLHALANIEDIVTLQVPTALVGTTGSTAVAVATIATAHVFATGKCMYKLYGTQNKGKANYAAVGEVDSEALKGAVELFHPGSKATADALALRFTNWMGLAFIQEADGTIRQYGSAYFPARLKISFDTGNNESYKGYKMEIMCYGLPTIYVPGLNFVPAP